MEFKQLEIRPRGNWFRRTISSPNFKRSLIATIIGAVIGFMLFYFTEGRTMEIIPGKDIMKSLMIGGFFGLFYTNSPCARGRC